MICFDREFSESARILMLKGAEIILTPNACELEANRIGQFARGPWRTWSAWRWRITRATEKRSLDRVQARSALARTNARSTARRRSRRGRRRVLAEFDMDKIRAWREHEAWAMRSAAGRYALLTSPPSSAIHSFERNAIMSSTRAPEKVENWKILCSFVFFMEKEIYRHECP